MSLAPSARTCVAVALLACPALPLRAEGLASQVDIAKCGGPTVRAVRVRAEGGLLRIDVRSDGPESYIRLILREPVSTKGKSRLVIEGRCEESSGLALCVAAVKLLGTAAGKGTVYEPDILLPPEWNQRTVLLKDFDGALPAQVQGIEFRLWAPGEAGKQYRLYLRRITFVSMPDVAAALSPGPTPRTRLEPRRVAVGEEHRRWVNFGPGGGGWYRVVAFSPHSGACFVGADVGGIYRSTDNCRTWEIVNAGITNRYVNAFAFHPTDASIVFAGSNGGVLKSTDAGRTWALKREGFPRTMTFGLSAPVSAVAVHPRRPEVVYAGIGHERGYGKLRKGTAGGRIFKSVDAGETWKMVELPGGDEARKLSVFCIRCHPVTPDRMYASTQGGLFVSDDAGDSWLPLGEGLSGCQTTFLVIKRDDPGTMLLAYSASEERRGGVLKSLDGGRSWHTSNKGLPSAQEAWRIIAHPRDTNTYYIGWHRRGGLYVTHDCAATWQPVNGPANIKSAWFFVGANVTGIDIDPLNPNRLVYCNDMDLYQTLDAGKTWDQAATNLVRPATADHPAVWQGRGCEVICVGGPQALAVDPTNPKTIYFGYWDVHAWKSDDGGRTCYRLTNGISSGYGRMGAVVLDPNNADIVYLSKGKNYDQHRIYKSVNGGKEFQMIGYEDTGLPPGGVFSLAIDPSSPIERRTIYAAVTGYGVYRSRDGGLSWQEASKGLPADSRKPMQLAIDPRNPRRLFVASSAHYHRDTKKRVHGYIARTTDGAEHWEVVKSRIEPQCILIDPLDSQKVYAGNRNFSGVDYPRAFYRSVDGGDTWASVGHEPFLRGPGSRDGDQGERVCVSGLAADPTRPGMIYAACREEAYDVNNGRGVFVSTDWGETWEPFTRTGLSNYGVGTLVVDPVNPSRLYVGTGGNGFFRFGEPPE